MTPAALSGLDLLATAVILVDNSDVLRHMNPAAENLLEVSTYPVGAMSDRMNRTGILIVGLLLLVAADLTLAFAPGMVGLFAGVMLWGLHMGFTQGLLATLVADSAPPELRGTAFGMFNLVTGAALLAASVLAGFLWDAFGPEWTFVAGAAFATLTIAALIPMRNLPNGRSVERSKT